jgi:G3E family GTPase
MNNRGKEQQRNKQEMIDAYESDDDEDDESVVPDLVAVEEVEEVVSPAAPPPPPCPVTILSGFLGSGKTTLINYILKSPNHGKRIAVIENEFGDGLQVERMIAREGIDDNKKDPSSPPSLLEFIELPNGCICCQVKDSLMLTLEALIAKRSDLDYILIECSGMANPGPIASLFWLDEGLSRLRLDGIVVLVDSYHIERQLAETVEASQQIGYADRILLNKIDLLDNNPQQLERLQTIIRSLQPTAPIRPTQFAAIPDLDWILDSKCFDAERAQQELDQYDDIANATGDPHCSTCQQRTGDEHEHGAKCGHTHHHHHHTTNVSTVCLKLDQPVDLEKIHHWLASILWPNQDEKDWVLRARIENDESKTGEFSPPTKTTTMTTTTTSTTTATTSSESNDAFPSDPVIFRVKGILDVRHPARNIYDDEHKLMEETVSIGAFVDEDGRDRRKYIVQAVHDLWDVFPSSTDWGTENDEEEERCSKLIVIGRFLNLEELQGGFEKCVAIENS